MTLLPLKPKQIYVVVRRMSDWDRYPTEPTLVRDSTILSIFRSENPSDQALVYYNFQRSCGLVPITEIHIFDWEARNQTNNGLTPAYVNALK